MKYHITLKFVMLWAWMEVKHWIYPNSNIFSYSAWRRDINCISRWESFGNIIKHFFSSFLLSYTIRRYHICSHYFNDFLKKLSKTTWKCLTWRRDIMVVHLEISTYFFCCFFVCVIFRKFWQLLKILVSNFKV
jgi:hypothetical protein